MFVIKRIIYVTITIYYCYYIETFKVKTQQNEITVQSIIIKYVYFHTHAVSHLLSIISYFCTLIVTVLSTLSIFKYDMLCIKICLYIY